MLITFVSLVMISTAFKIHLQNTLQKCGVLTDEIISIRSITGGSVNKSYGIYSLNRSFFVKVNNLDAFPNMFEKEKKGLDTLRGASSISVPEVLIEGSFKEQAYLVLEHILPNEPNKNYWENFGKGLSELHLNSSSNFGLAYDNYNGSLVQVNNNEANWAKFFVENRLQVQQKQARDKGRLDSDLSRMLDKLYPKLERFFPEEQPALLHGDLWSGNYLVNRGNPCFMDPAVYYGHREVDLAMSLLFGGFDKKMYEVYHHHFPLEKGWEKRVDVLNLYPLMVHVNLFGASYAQRVKSVIKHFV